MSSLNQMTLYRTRSRTRKTAESSQKLPKARLPDLRHGTVSGRQKPMLERCQVPRNHAHQRPTALRTAAAAIALVAAVPCPFPKDVSPPITSLGHGNHFRAGSQCLSPFATAAETRFSYPARKNQTSPLRPAWNKFIDALILQKIRIPRYLGQFLQRPRLINVTLH